MLVESEVMGLNGGVKAGILTPAAAIPPSPPALALPAGSEARPS